MSVTISLAVGLGLHAATALTPDAEVAGPRCPGPRLEEVEARVATGDRFAFSGAMRAPFMSLWRRGERPPLPVEPDSVTLLAAPGEPFIIVYGRTGCALAVLRVNRPEVFRAMRSSIGPAV